MRRWALGSAASLRHRNSQSAARRGAASSSSSSVGGVLTVRAALGVLGLTTRTLKGREFTHKDIKKAYIAQTLKCHPDLFPDDKGAHQRFQQLQDALAIATRAVGGGGGSGQFGADGDEGDNRLLFAEQLRLVMERHKGLRDELESLTTAPHAAPPASTINSNSSGSSPTGGGDQVSLGEVVSVCSQEAEALATINRFRTTLAKTLSGDQFTLFDTFVLYNPLYVKAMAKCSLRFSRDLPLIVRRVVTHRRRHIANSGLQKANASPSRGDKGKALRYRQGTAAGRGMGAAMSSAGRGGSAFDTNTVSSSVRAGGTNDTIESMPMKPLVLVGALVFAHPKVKAPSSSSSPSDPATAEQSSSSSAASSSCKMDGSFAEEDDESVPRAHGPHSIKDIQCCRELICVIHPNDSIDDIVAKVGAWEGRSYERLRVELAMVQSAKTLSHLLGMVSVPFAVHHMLYRTTDDAVLASLTMQRLVCLLAGLVGPDTGAEGLLRGGGSGYGTTEDDIIGDEASFMASIEEDGGERVIRSMLLEIAVAQADGSLLSALGGGGGAANSSHRPQVTLLWRPPTVPKAASVPGQSAANSGADPSASSESSCEGQTAGQGNGGDEKEASSSASDDTTDTTNSSSTAGPKKSPPLPPMEEPLVRSMDEFLPEEDQLSAAYHDITAREVAHEHALIMYRRNQRNNNNNATTMNSSHTAGGADTADPSAAAAAQAAAAEAEQGFLGTPRAFLEGATMGTYGHVTRDHAACDPTVIRYTMGVELHKNPIRFLRSVVVTQREVIARAKASNDAMGPIVTLRKRLESDEFIPKAKVTVRTQQEHQQEEAEAAAREEMEAAADGEAAVAARDVSSPDAAKTSATAASAPRPPSSAPTTTGTNAAADGSSDHYYGGVEGDIGELREEVGGEGEWEYCGDTAEGIEGADHYRPNAGDGASPPADDASRGGAPRRRRAKSLAAEPTPLPTPFSMPPVDHPTDDAEGSARSIFFKPIAGGAKGGDVDAAIDAAMEEEGGNEGGGGATRKQHSSSSHQQKKQQQQQESVSPTFGDYASHYPAAVLENSHIVTGGDGKDSDILLTFEARMERETAKRLNKIVKQMRELGVSEEGAEVIAEDMNPSAPSHWAAGKKINAGRAADEDGFEDDADADSSDDADADVDRFLDKSQRAKVRRIERMQQEYMTDKRDMQWGKEASPDFVRFHPGTADKAKVEYVHRPAIRLVSRTFGMEGATELLLWQRLFEHREQLAQLAASMNSLNVHYGRIDDGNPSKSMTGGGGNGSGNGSSSSSSNSGGSSGGADGFTTQQEEEVGGWYGESVDGDKVIVTKAILHDSGLFSLWLQDVAEQSAMAKEATRTLKKHRIHYVARDPRLPLTQYLSFVKVYCAAEGARAQLEMRGSMRANPYQPLTPEVVGFSVTVGNETAIRDGGNLVIPWYADPATLVTLLSEKSITLELEGQE